MSTQKWVETESKVNKTRPAAVAAASAAAVQKLALHTRRKSSKPSCAGPPTDQQQSRSAGAFLLPKFKWTSRNIAQVLHFTCLTCCGPVCDFRAVGYCLPVESSSQSSTVSCLQEIRKEKKLINFGRRKINIWIANDEWKCVPPFVFSLLDIYQCLDSRSNGSCEFRQSKLYYIRNIK